MNEPIIPHVTPPLASAAFETGRARGERLLAQAERYERNGQRALGSALRKMAVRALTRANLADEGIKQEPKEG